jgi:nucleotide-binding universal stress UspA family protein
MHLLIALDNSPLNERITGFLRGFLSQLSGVPTLSFIHVIDNRFIGSGMGYPDIVMSYELSNCIAESDEALISQIKKEGHKMIEDIQKQLGVTGTIDSPPGDPVTTLAEACQQKKPDFLVMGTHSRRGINHFLFGNFAEKVLRHVNVPLMIIPENINILTTH